MICRGLNLRAYLFDCSAQAAKDSILYSYTKSFNGFAAVFSEQHAQSLRGKNRVQYIS